MLNNERYGIREKHITPKTFQGFRGDEKSVWFGEAINGRHQYFCPGFGGSSNMLPNMTRVTLPCGGSAA